MRRLPVLLAALVLSGCVTFKNKDGIEREVNELNFFGHEVYGEEASDAPEENSTYVLGAKTKKKADGTAFGFLRANRRLYAPFEVMVLAGLVPDEDQSGFTGNAQICMELDERSTITEDIADLLWVLVCARREGAGLRVRAQDQFATLGSVLLPDTDAAILSIRHDGTDLIFETAPADLLGAPVANGGLQEIARLEDWLPVASNDALVPSMGTSFLAHPAVVGFTHAQVLGNGDPVPGLTEEQGLGFDVGPAVDALVQAYELLNGLSPDPTEARVQLVASQEALQTVLDGVDTLPKGKLQKQARGALKSALKAVAAAIARIDKEAPAIKVLKKVGAAARSAMQAIQALDPVPHF